MQRRMRIMPRLLALLLFAVPAHAAGPVIQAQDVTRFYQIYDAAHGHPSALQLDQMYLTPGSEALHEFARLRNVTGARIADTIEKNQAIYEQARSCLAVLPSVKQRLTVAFDKLAHLYPAAKFPPVTFVIGRGRPVGITSASGAVMGLEALCAADFMDPNLENRFVHTIAHEYGHVQQTQAARDLEAGMPGATVLHMSLIEGAAEFTAELISGDVGNYQHKAWTKGREAAIEAKFVADMDKTDLSDWMNNGPGTAEKPGDLGYWVGYRIVKSYYEHAPDKHQALREIFELRDPKAFLAKSGWKPAG
jgi:hypothetical protein